MLVLILLVLSGRSCNLQICSLSSERDDCTFPVSADKLSADICATAKPYCASIFLAWSLCCSSVLSLCSEYTGYAVIQTVDFKNYNQTSKQRITTMIINSKQLDWTSVFPLEREKNSTPKQRAFLLMAMCLPQADDVFYVIACVLSPSYHF